MTIELQEATPEDIAQFKHAAAQRFKERGVPPALAEAAFERYMGKVAGQLGIQTPPSDRIQKLADAIREELPAVSTSK